METALSSLNPKSIFLVVDRSAYQLSGAQAELAPHLENREVLEFDSFASNPRFEDALAGLEQFRRAPCDVIIALGGGTAIDIGKLIRCFAGQSREPADILANSSLIEKAACPLIAVPTTAGTGSEATQFAVVYRGGVKHSVAHPSIMPDVAVVDWRLTQSLPPRTTAETGLDALSQSIESIWSVNSTQESVAYATAALELVLSHLVSAVHTPTPHDREAMTGAAHLAGKAINIGKTTAPHALSYRITHDFGVAHGHAVSLTLGPVLIFNAGATTQDVADERGVEHLQEMINLILSKLGVQDAQEAQSKITEFMESIGCQTRLSSLGIETDARIPIAESVNQERLKNNPRRFTQSQLLQLLESIQ